MNTSKELLTTGQNDDVVKPIRVRGEPALRIVEEDQEKIARLMRTPFLVTHPKTGIITTGQYVGDRSSPDKPREVITRIKALLQTEEIISVPLQNIRKIGQIQQPE